MRLARLATAAVAAVTLVWAAQAVAAPPRYVDPFSNSPPVAAFTVVPLHPYTGDEVTLTSFSSDKDGPLASQAWDLDGDGRFDDARGPVASATFRKPGPHTVSLRVTDLQGASGVQFQTINVRRRSSSARQLLMSPFPIVRIVGRLTRRGARITLLSVSAPRRARVTLRCKRGRCPYRRVSVRVRRRSVVFKRMRRTFGAGTVIELFVSQPGRIGKYTRFRIRRDRAPARVDRCLMPGATRGSRCPGD